MKFQINQAFSWNFKFKKFNIILNHNIFDIIPNKIYFLIGFKKSINSMKFWFKNLNKTPLHMAVERGNEEVVQLLMLRPELDVNVKAVWKVNFFSHIILS